MSRRVERYWYAIVLIFAVAAGLFGYHLLTSYTPPRAAITIGPIAIYWYAIWIIIGILLGAWVVMRLVEERARRVFLATVPAEVREQPVAEAGLAEDVAALLAERKLGTVGEALYEMGLDPRRLLMKREQEALAVAALRELWPPDEAGQYPWRIWNPDYVLGGLALMAVLGLIGARLYHVLTPSPSMAAVGIFSARDYLRQPLQLLNIRSGGLGIYGGMAGSLLAILIYTRYRRIPTLGWADLAVVGAALGQAVGRWGNFFNQELYGRPSDLPWAIYIEPQYRLPDLVDFSYFHPAFLYESLWSLLTFFVLLWLARRRSDRLLPGELLALYLVAYATGRSLLELVRLDSRAVPFLGLETGLAVATLVSIVVAAVAVALVAIRRLARRQRAG